ncbi:MAG: ATP-binding protein [Planctomycetota bacterium]
MSGRRNIQKLRLLGLLGRPFRRQARDRGLVSIRRGLALVIVVTCITLLGGLALEVRMDRGLLENQRQLIQIVLDPETVSAETAEALIEKIEAESWWYRLWRIEIWGVLISLALFGGIGLCVALGRVNRDFNQRQKEIHRQNLELESIHLNEMHLRKVLDRERARLQLIMDTIPQGVFWKDLYGNILGRNHAMDEMLGLNAPNSRRGESELHEDNLPWTESQRYRFRRDDQRIIDTGQPRLEQEETIVRPDGVTLAVLISKVPLRDADGAAIGLLYSVIDITQRKQLEQQLSHAHKMESIGELAAGVAHEINTPTQFVSENMRFLGEAIEKFQRFIAQQEAFADPDGPQIGWAERHEKLHDLKDEIDYDFINEEAPRAVQESVEGLDRIRHIVTAMREFSHPGEGSAQDFDLNRVIETSATVCRNRWKYIAEIEFDLDPDLPTAHGHAGELGQVIVNLIVNAADALELAHPREAGFDATGRIYLTTRATEDWIEIVVADNGTGVPEEIIPRVFDPFFTTKDVGQGTGQGLSITHNVVVTNHGGEVDLTNQPNGGAKFTLRLPRKNNPSAARDAA